MDFSTLKLAHSAEKIINGKENSKLISDSYNKESHLLKTRCFTVDNEKFLDSSPNSQHNKETPPSNDRAVSFLSKKSVGSCKAESILGTPKTDFIIENISFKVEKQFIDQECCEVCGVDFSKKFGLKVFTKKFCFICGKAICRVCSKRKINGKRVCDLCLLRVRSKNAENRKKEILMLDKKKINSLKFSIDDNKQQNVLIWEEIHEIEDNIKKSAEENKKGLEILEKNFEDKKLMEFQLQQKFRGLSDEFSKMKKKEKTIKDQFELEKANLDMMRKHLEDKKSFYLQKVQEFAQLKKHREEMEKSESFVSMMKSKSLLSGEKKSHISNFLENSNKSPINKNNQDEKNNENSISYSYRERKSSLLMNNNHKNSINKELPKKKCYPCN